MTSQTDNIGEIISKLKTSSPLNYQDFFQNLKIFIDKTEYTIQQLDFVRNSDGKKHVILTGGSDNSFYSFLSKIDPINIFIDKYNNIMYGSKKSHHCELCKNKDEKIKILLFLLWSVLNENETIEKKLNYLLESSKFITSILLSEEENHLVYDKLNEYNKYKLSLA